MALLWLVLTKLNGIDLLLAFSLGTSFFVQIPETSSVSHYEETIILAIYNIYPGIVAICVCILLISLHSIKHSTFILGSCQPSGRNWKYICSLMFDLLKLTLGSPVWKYCVVFIMCQFFDDLSRLIIAWYRTLFAFVGCFMVMFFVWSLAEWYLYIFIFHPHWIDEFLYYDIVSCYLF